MKITLHPTKDWQVDDRGLTLWLPLGPLRVDNVDFAIVVPPGADLSTIVTRGGWPIAIAEFHDARTACLVATVTIADETASVRAQCPLEHVEENWPRLTELLQTARPSWPETILLSDLLALPI